MNHWFVRALLLLQFDRLFDFLQRIRTEVRLLRLSRAGLAVKFVSQGGYELHIVGNVSKFKMHPSSHLKSDTFVECSGGVTIGRYFHVGRGLTIFSTVHDFRGASALPYDSKTVDRPVSVEDFVWCGANVTILPGVTIGEGAIIGAGAIVTEDVPACTIVAGNPARAIGVRDRAHFEELKAQESYY